MNGTKANALCLVAIGLVGLLSFGCASANVNPPRPRANTGYVDFYAEPAVELAWNIELTDALANPVKTLFAELEPAEGGVLRLAFAPGRHHLRVSFLNRVIAAPAVVEVTVLDGRITPVQATLIDAGTTSVQTRTESRGGTAYGRYGRRTKIGSQESKMYRVSAAPQPSQPYREKAQMAYAQPATK